VNHPLPAPESAPLRAAIPHALPYFAFLAVLQAGAFLPPGLQGAVLPVQVAVPGVLFAIFLARGAYPELRGYRPGTGGLLVDVGAGLAIAALWTLPYLLVDSLPRGEEVFDPAQLGAERSALAWGIRALGYAAVTPFVEELFVRSLLWRWIAAGLDGDFRSVPVGARVGSAAVVTTLLFALAHQPWEWPVAIPTGAAFAALLWSRGHLMSCVIAHVVANGTILALAYGYPDRFGFFV